MTFTELQREIAEWSRATFPNQTAARIGEHLIEEADEVWAELQAEPNADVPELSGCAADVVILLLALANCKGFDLGEAVRTRHMRNVASRFAYDPARGYDKRVGTESPVMSECATCHRLIPMYLAVLREVNENGTIRRFPICRVCHPVLDQGKESP